MVILIQSESKKTLLPVVVATRIPAWPRWPLITEMNFPGSVVAIERNTTPIRITGTDSISDVDRSAGKDKNSKVDG